VTEDIVSAVRAHLHSQIGGPAPTAASVTFLGLEPIEVLRFGSDRDDLVRYATAGCSRHPMGDPGDLVTDSLRGPRAELILTLQGGAGVASGIHKSLAVLAAAPAVEGVILLPDALLDLGEPMWKGSPFTAGLLGISEIDDLPLTEPAEPVRFFEVAPITGTEAAWVRLRGADALREAWREVGIDIRDPRRGAAQL
jgi:hypothetical protein